jgi:predicted ferric reductase
MRHTRGEAVAWLTLYVVLATAPLLVALAGVLPPARPYLVEAGVALGFVGLGMLWLQFGLTARFRRIAGPFGLDTMLQYHRQVGVVAWVFVLLHPALVIAGDPVYASFLDPRVDVPRAAALWLVVGALTVLLGTTFWRERLGLSYRVWRAAHALLASLVIFIGLVHVLRVGYYIDTSWQRGLVVAGTAGALGLLVYTRAVMPWQARQRPWRVASVRPLAQQVWSVVVEPEGHDGLSFEPGQFVWVTMGGSPFTTEQHPFTISSSAAMPGRIELAIKELGDFTSTVGSIPAGTVAYLEGPHGAFALPPDRGARVVMIAGGIGITPFVSMLRTLRDRAERRPVLLIYATADEHGRGFDDELEALAAALPLEFVRVAERAMGDWSGRTGMVDAALLADLAGEPMTGDDFLVCGPDPMMDAVERALLDAGVPAGRIDSERFRIA